MIVNLRKTAAEMYKKLLTVKPEIVHYTRDQLIKLVMADEASEKGTYKILSGKNALGPMSCCYRVDCGDAHEDPKEAHIIENEKHTLNIVTGDFE